MLLATRDMCRQTKRKTHVVIFSALTNCLLPHSIDSKRHIIGAPSCLSRVNGMPIPGRTDLRNHPVVYAGDEFKLPSSFFRAVIDELTRSRVAGTGFD